jgi:hypothetical protein
MFLAIHAFFIFDTYPLTVAGNIVTAVCLFSLLLAYVLTIASGPSYAPYDWGKTRREHYSWDYMMTHLVQYQYQVQIAKSTTDRPPRSSYSSAAHRFVLRADHFCLWAQSWIGIRNHRFFMLTCLWSVVYALANVVFRYSYFQSLVSQKFDWVRVPGLASVLALLGFTVFTGYQFVFASRNLLDNRTSIEVWLGRSSAD